MVMEKNTIKKETKEKNNQVYGKFLWWPPRTNTMALPYSEVWYGLVSIHWIHLLRTLMLE